MSPGHYRPHRRDLEFVLLELLGRDRVLAGGSAAYPDDPPGLDPDGVRAALVEMERLAVGPLAASFSAADREPPRVGPDGDVVVPAPFRRSYEAYRDAEWWRLDVPTALGGTACPPSVRWAVQELVLGANPALHMYACGYVFAGLLHALGTADQRRLAALMVERGWGASMALTEDDAGSDLSRVRTVARPQPDGSWHLDGAKRFVTNADHDLTPSIVHFVLARPEGAASGTRGLSLFVVPKHLPDPATGEPGPRNGVRVGRLEDKLGLHASATGELVLGRHGAPAVGWLVGDVHDGLRQVFHLVGDARMMVGTKSMATLSTGYLHALDHARTRVQGRDLARRGDASAPQVPLVQHPDVARVLLDAKAQAEGLRALVLLGASALDADGSPGRAALLLPVVKAYASERANQHLAALLQVAGGAGFTTDLPFEQYLRDVRVDTIYEGTTAIQALGLFFRQVVRDDGAGLGALLDEVARTADPSGTDDPDDPHTLAEARAALRTAVADLRAGADALLALAAADENRRAGEHTTALLMALGDLLVTWLLLRSADVATERLAAGDHPASDASFYRGKQLAARHAARTLLPSATRLRDAVASGPSQLTTLDPTDL